MSQEKTIEELQGIILGLESNIEGLKSEIEDKDVKLKSMIDLGKQLRIKNDDLNYNPETGALLSKMNYELTMADKFIKSNAFPSLNAEQAFTIMRAGEEMGLSPLKSLSTLYIIKGQIQPYGKGMIGIITSAGYQLKYTNESVGKCTVELWKNGDKIAEETALASDVKKNGAYAFAPKHKLRYHAVRLLASFTLPHLFGSVQTDFDFESNPEISEKINPTTVITETEEEKRVRMHIDKSTSLDQLHKCQAYFNGDSPKQELIELFSNKSKELK